MSRDWSAAEALTSAILRVGSAHPRRNAEERKRSSREIDVRIHEARERRSIQRNPCVGVDSDVTVSSELLRPPPDRERVALRAERDYARRSASYRVTLAPARVSVDHHARVARASPPRWRSHRRGYGASVEKRTRMVGSGSRVRVLVRLQTICPDDHSDLRNVPHVCSTQMQLLATVIVSGAFASSQPSSTGRFDDELHGEVVPSASRIRTAPVPTASTTRGIGSAPGPLDDHDTTVAAATRSVAIRRMSSSRPQRDNPRLPQRETLGQESFFARPERWPRDELCSQRLNPWHSPSDVL